MTLDELYTAYGKLMIQMEILQAQIQPIKQQIAEAINKANQSVAPAAPTEGE